MPSIKKIMKTVKRKNGLKNFSMTLKQNGERVRFSPSDKKEWRRIVAESLRTNFANWKYVH